MVCCASDDDVIDVSRRPLSQIDVNVVRIPIWVAFRCVNLRDESCEAAQS